MTCGYARASRLTHEARACRGSCLTPTETEKQAVVVCRDPVDWFGLSCVPRVQFDQLRYNDHGKAVAGHEKGVYVWDPAGWLGTAFARSK